MGKKLQTASSDTSAPLGTSDSLRGNSYNAPAAALEMNSSFVAIKQDDAAAAQTPLKTYFLVATSLHLLKKARSINNSLGSELHPTFCSSDPGITCLKNKRPKKTGFFFLLCHLPKHGAQRVDYLACIPMRCIHFAIIILSGLSTILLLIFPLAPISPLLWLMLNWEKMDSGENNGLNLRCLDRPEVLLPPGELQTLFTDSDNSTTLEPNQKCVDDWSYAFLAFIILGLWGSSIFSSSLIKCIGDHAKIKSHDNYFTKLQSMLSTDSDCSHQAVISFITGLKTQSKELLENEEPELCWRPDGTLRNHCFATYEAHLQAQYSGISR